MKPYAHDACQDVNDGHECQPNSANRTPKPGHKIELPARFEAFANLAEGTILTTEPGSAERRAAVEFVDRVMDSSGGRLDVFSPAAWRNTFRRGLAALVGPRVVVRHAGHARARRTASGRRGTGSSASAESGDGGSGDPDPEGLRFIAEAAFATAHEFHGLGWISDGADFFYALGRDLRRRADAIEHGALLAAGGAQ